MLVEATMVCAVGVLHVLDDVIEHAVGTESG